MERDLRGLTILAMPQDAIARHPSLKRAKDDAAQFSERTLWLRGSFGLMNEDGDVVKIPEFRWPGGSLEGVKTDGQPLVFHEGVQ